MSNPNVQQPENTHRSLKSTVIVGLAGLAVGSLMGASLQHRVDSNSDGSTQGESNSPIAWVMDPLVNQLAGFERYLGVHVAEQPSPQPEAHKHDTQK
jgi:uncharacterized membrane protein